MSRSDQIKVELQEWMGSDRSIATAAWTSSSTLQSKELKTDEDVKRILSEVLTKPINTIEDCLHQHASPFEAVHLRFWIKLPISIDRQHMTHRIASHNGMSGRYRTMPYEYLDIPEDVESIIEKLDNKITWPNPTQTKIFPMEEYIDICEQANNFYNAFCTSIKELEKKKKITNSEMKRLREFFRGVLPQHNMTERVTLINLRSFANYQKLRNSKFAQPEIRQIAEMMLEEVKKANICPIAIEILERNSWMI